MSVEQDRYRSNQRMQASQAIVGTLVGVLSVFALGVLVFGAILLSRPGKSADLPTVRSVAVGEAGALVLRVDYPDGVTCMTYFQQISCVIRPVGE